MSSNSETEQLPLLGGRTLPFVRDRTDDPEPEQSCDNTLPYQRTLPLDHSLAEGGEAIVLAPAKVPYTGPERRRQTLGNKVRRILMQKRSWQDVLALQVEQTKNGVESQVAGESNSASTSDSKDEIKTAPEAAVAAGQQGLSPRGRQVREEDFNLSEQDLTPVNPAVIEYVNNMQRWVVEVGNCDPAPPAPGAVALRLLRNDAPPGLLSQNDESIIVLMVKVFDYIGFNPIMYEEVKILLEQLQVPVLKAALLDRKFFLSGDNPARRLIEVLADAGAAWHIDCGLDAPLFQLIQHCVTRVINGFDPQAKLFIQLLNEFESFVAEQECLSELAMAERITEAMRQEAQHQALEKAENDLAERIETGEVAGFVETFLGRYWIQVLTHGYQLQAERPEVLDHALRTMDDMIWSVKPKFTATQRQELITKLPKILSKINDCLDTILCEDPDRANFFTMLAERHAIIARTPPSVRRQIEFAVNSAQKASERRLTQRFKAPKGKMIDDFVKKVSDLSVGAWFDLTRRDGVLMKYKLSWISPSRLVFIFIERYGPTVLTMSASELAQKLRERSATIVVPDSLVEVALAAAFEGGDFDEGMR